MPERDYTNSSQQLLLRVITHLAENPFRNNAVVDIHLILGCGRDRIFRTLWNLEQAGLVFKNRNNGYQLTSRWVAMMGPLCSRSITPASQTTKDTEQ